MSLVKTRLRASRRGEVPSPVGVRQPNPYENVRIFLEFAIYRTHVVLNNRSVVLIREWHDPFVVPFSDWLYFITSMTTGLSKASAFSSIGLKSSISSTRTPIAPNDSAN